MFTNYRVLCKNATGLLYTSVEGDSRILFYLLKYKFHLAIYKIQKLKIKICFSQNSTEKNMFFSKFNKKKHVFLKINHLTLKIY